MRFASQPLKFKWPRASLIAVVLTAAPHGGGPAAATTPPGDDAAAMALTFETLGRRLAHDGDRDGAGRAMG